MKTLILFGLLFSHLSIAATISGIVTAKGNLPAGTLFIFAKKFDGSMPMPLAVKKIVNPVFPVKFELSDNDKMIPDLEFKGPFKVTARISPSGSAMDKTGIEVSTKEKVQAGTKGLNLVLEK